MMLVSRNYGLYCPSDGRENEGVEKVGLNFFEGA